MNSIYSVKKNRLTKLVNKIKNKTIEACEIILEQLDKKLINTIISTKVKLIRRLINRENIDLSIRL